MAVEAGGIGARLRAGREKLGLTVLQVAERMHTDAKIVEAIESESYEALGAPVYARGHIRHYAELVGESANELIQIYSDLSRVAQPDLTRIVKAPAGPDSSKLVAPALVVIVVFAVAGAIWWVSALSKKKPQMSETHVVTDEAPASATTEPTSGAAPLSEPSGAADEGASMASAPGGTAPGGPSTASVQGVASRGGASTSSATAPPRSGVGGSAAAPGGTTRPASGAATHAAPSAVATRAAPSAAAPTQTARITPSAAAPTPPTAPAPTRTASAAPVVAPSAADGATAPRPRNQSQVTLRYSADSWTEVYDSTGARLFYDVGTANSVKTVVGTPPLRVVLGNASGVAVEYNGHSKPIAKLSRPDGSVQFSITRSGEVVRAKPVADGG